MIRQIKYSTWFKASDKETVNEQWFSMFYFLFNGHQHVTLGIF